LSNYFLIKKTPIIHRGPN